MLPLSTLLVSALLLAATSAQPSCNTTYYPDFNLDGTNLPDQPVTPSGTAAACAAQCCAVPACNAFTLNAGGGDCYLKSAIGPPRPNAGAVSGVLRGPRPPPSPGPSPAPPPPAAGYLDAVADCGADASGATDSTARLQACIDRAYARSVPRVPVLLPRGTYLVSDTLSLTQQYGGPDDGINVVPGRFLPHIFFGQPAGPGGQRPTLRLAPSAPGFDAPAPASYKPVVRIMSADGEGVDMNNLFKGVDLDLTAAGNPGAVGVSHPGAQGATVADVTVTASPGAFACFAGLNGAGGLHANIRCVGARYGLYIDDSQPVPAAVGATLLNQSVSAVLYAGQETLSLVGAVIVRPPGATGPAISTRTPHGMSIVDSTITCAPGAQGPAALAIDTTASLFLRDVYILGCQQAVPPLGGGAALPGPPPGAWLHVAQLAAAVPVSQWYTPAIYTAGVRQPAGATVLRTDSAPPPPDAQARHLWQEASFPDMGTPGVVDARSACGALGNGHADDTAALQACLDTHTHVFLPPGIYRISATLLLPPGGSLVGMGNAASYIAAASAGLPSASAAAPAPLLRTAEDSGPDAAPTTLAHLGLLTWQHLPHVTTLHWRSRHPLSLWRTNFESRDCECLWLSAYSAAAPALPCALPVNLTVPRTTFAGLGRVYSFVNDDTGSILSTGAAYRSLLVADTAGFAAPDSRLRFYSLNLEHAQSEANGELRNASYVDIYSIKGEGNAPLLWLRGSVANVSVLGLGGGITPFEYNFTQPPDFEQRSPSIFRVDAGAAGVTFAALLDHGYGAQAPFWPPSGGSCTWGHGYPYPGEAIPYFPWGTWPNCTMWRCWYGKTVATAYWWMISDGSGQAGAHTDPTDKPVYWTSQL
jgi:hypothetical protein